MNQLLLALLAAALPADVSQYKEPPAPIPALLDAAPSHDCTITHLPDAPHCSEYNANLGELCLDWFAALP